jgi:CheY-like chemotaxis protein
MADILVVDDNPTNLKLLELTLRAAGHAVRLAHDATHAEALINDTVPELILMDLQLPGVDGLTLTRKLKSASRTQHVPIIAVTSYAMDGDAARAHAAGCDGYVCKPIDTRALPALLGGFIRGC